MTIGIKGVALQLAIGHCWEPGDELRPEANDENADELQYDEGYFTLKGAGKSNYGSGFPKKSVTETEGVIPRGSLQERLLPA